MNQALARPLRSERKIEIRFWVFTAVLFIAGAIVILRLGKLQILDHQMYNVLASDQHDLQTKLMPDRGRILIRDRTDGKLYPLASNREAWLVYATPKNMTDPVKVAQALAPLLGMQEVDLISKLNKPDDPYENIAKDVPYDTVLKIKELRLEGIAFASQNARLYPEKNMGGQVIGLVTPDDQGNLIGRYGVESSYQEILAGKPGSLIGEKDATGRRLIFTDQVFREAVNGADIVLTLDRSIQYKACELIKQGVLDYEADNGSIIVADPETGAITAMCSYPDFDPGDLKNIEDVGVFNNQAVFAAYEPGSVFKAITMASGIEAGKVGPKTTYLDTGLEEIDDHKIKNSDGKANGVQTMQEVMEKSLNTGTIFVQRQLGKVAFQQYVKKFGFGEKTEIGLKPEAAGNISSLDKKGNIWAATASFGQGITATPIQMVAAYGALANQGKLMKPYIVSEIDYPDGRKEVTEPKAVGQPISSRASRLISGMLVSVVENGHGKKAGVPGYWVAAKTGTAQVAKTNGVGYEANEIKATMLGYAPADDPKFVMLVKFDNPRKSDWAETCAAPVFGSMASYILRYLDVKPTRD
ncbi:MAG: penicillin-binding protein 2 [Patescibacteria group bacterium]|nr:penicillin-binding protein 2 [Patescibacteria group bacterium]